MRPALPFILFAASFCLGLGIVLPLITVERLFVFTDTPSLVTMIAGLWREGDGLLAAIIALFSVCFPCLKLAYDALQAGGSAPAILNAANEVAVQAFLERRIGFREIDRSIARTLARMPGEDIADLGSLLEADRRARAITQEMIAT